MNLTEPEDTYECPFESDDTYRARMIERGETVLIDWTEYPPPVKQTRRIAGLPVRGLAAPAEPEDTYECPFESDDCTESDRCAVCLNERALDEGADFYFDREV